MSREDRETQFRELFELHSGPVLRYFLARLHNISVSEDLLEMTFEFAWKRLEERPDDVRVWLYRIARRTISNYWRSIGREAALAERLISNQTIAIAYDHGSDYLGADGLRVSAALAELRPREQEAIRLVFWDELSHSEAAAVLGCSVNALDILLHRARRRLAEKLTSLDKAGDKHLA